MTTLTAHATRPWRLGGRSRKATLLVHIASAGVWLGIDVVMAVVVFTAVSSDDPATDALCFRALDLFAVWSLLVAGLTCLASGVLLGLGSKYGLVRYWWVAAKLALNLLLTSLVLVALRPAVSAAAEQGRLADSGAVAHLAVGDLVYPPVVSTTLLLVAMTLSIFKPWGLIRRRRLRG